MKEAPTWRLFIPRDLMFYDGISRSFSHDDSTPTVVVRLIGLCFGNPTSMVPDARPLFLAVVTAAISVARLQCDVQHSGNRSNHFAM